MANEFRELWVNLSPDEKRQLAVKGKTSVAYLSQVANGQRRAGTKTIRNLVAADQRLSYETFLGRTAS